MKPMLLTLVLLLFLPGFCSAQSTTDPILHNQTGFYDHAPKMAIVQTETAGPFFLLTENGADTVFRGRLSEVKKGEFSGESRRTADFSSFETPGRYLVVVPNVGASFPFEINAAIHQQVANSALKGFYFQRASTALPAEFAGKWARAAGHPDSGVLVHPSAASPNRPAGTRIASSGGWYDAGDYNKYIVNSGITMGTLLSLAEDFPETTSRLNPGIPEANNDLPDLLDEVLWNLRWMLTMQDPGDGGVYHKLTNPEFGPLAQMPADATSVRYVVQKSTAATLDFAAVMAQASRVYRPWQPKLADSCLLAARNAWNWAVQHPDLQYNQEAMNAAFDPDVHTGAYGDSDLRDEWIWAAAELYLSTGENSFYQFRPLLPDVGMPLPSWSQVRLLGYYSLLRHEEKLSKEARQDVEALKKRLLERADALVANAQNSSMAVAMGGNASDFEWGSNAVAANQGILLVQAWRVTKDPRYAEAALSNLDYLLGRNATGYCFLTGFGSKQVMHPHHRPSEGDRVTQPVPGLLSGGPNPGQQDHCEGYPSSLPDASFIDASCSYASNEIAINWNAPMVYLAAAMEAIWGEK